MGHNDGAVCQSAPGRHHATPGSPDVGRGWDRLALVGLAETGSRPGLSGIWRTSFPVLNSRPGED